QTVLLPGDCDDRPHIFAHCKQLLAMLKRIFHQELAADVAQCLIEPEGATQGHDPCLRMNIVRKLRAVSNLTARKTINSLPVISYTKKSQIRSLPQHGCN